MTPLDTFQAAVRDGGRKVGGTWRFRCPVHDDRKPSLGVREAPDGRLLVRCYAGCQTIDVLDALGLEFVDLYPERPSW